MRLQTLLFDNEGKENIQATIDAAAKSASDLGIAKILIFASAAQNIMSLVESVGKAHEVIAVTFPAEMTARVGENNAYIGIPSVEDRRRLADASVQIIQGVMPFRALGSLELPPVQAVLTSLGLFGGGMELCVQAVLMACDAGAVLDGERCIALSADTAIIVRAGHAFRFMGAWSRFAIEHIICKPLNYQISRPKANSTVSPLLAHEGELVEQHALEPVNTHTETISAEPGSQELTEGP